MKEPLNHLRGFLFLLIIILVPSYTQCQLSDTLNSSSFFNNKYGKQLKSKSDSITDYYMESITKSINLGDHFTQLDALINLALLNRSNKNNENSYSFLAQAEECIEKNNIDSPIANYLIKDCYAALHYDEEDYSDATRYYLQALKIYNDNSYNHIEQLINIYSRLSTCYLYIQKYDSCIIYIDKSDNLLSSIINKKSFYALNNAWKRGSILANTGNRREAINTLLKSVNSIDEDQYSYQMAVIYSDIAYNYFSLREIDKSIQYYNQTIKVYQQLKYPVYPWITREYSALAIVYNHMGEIDKALELAQICIKYEKEHNDPYILYSYQRIATSYMALDSLNLADKYFRKTMQLINDKAQEWSSFTKASFKFYYGHFLIEKLQDDQGVELTTEAADIYKTLFGGKHPRLADCYNFLGKAKILINKNPDEALKYYQKALIANDKTFNNLNIYENPKIENALSRKILLAILTDKADALSSKIRQESNLTDKLANIELMNQSLLLAINTIDYIRTSFTSVDSKLKMNEKTESLYSKLISSTIDLYKITNDNKHLYNAYEYTENSKLSTLNGLINEDNAKITSNVPEALLAKEKNLRIKKGELINQLYNLEKTENIDQQKKDWLSKELFNIDQEIDLLAANLENNYENYFNLKYKNEHLGVTQLQKQLSDKQSVIEYYLTESKLFGFFINKDSLKLNTIEIDTNFYANIDSLSSIFKNQSFTYFDNEQFDFFKEKAYNLYNILIEPMNDLLKENELIIIPDKELLQFPFEILLTNPASNIQNYRNLPYLIKNQPVSYSYSSEWLFHKRSTKKASKNLLAIVPSYNSNIDYENLIHLENKRIERDILLPLPAALKEANSILKSVNGEILESEQASESRFKEMAGQFSILHFAMHTIIDNSNPMFSKLIFTPSDLDSINNEDNLLNTYEIFNLELNANMVVLSSCNSGFGNLQKGEGIMSMARGFIFAGCPSLAITLWSIDDEASADLMSFYYQNLAQGMNKSKALQLAKIEFLKSADPIRIHPHFWASHILVGDTKPLKLGKNSISIYCLVILIGMLLIGVFFRKKFIRVIKEFLPLSHDKNPSVLR